MADAEQVTTDEHEMDVSLPVSFPSLPMSLPSTTVGPTTLFSRVEKYKSVSPPSKKARHVLCEHCDNLLSLKTYKKHQMLFYNPDSGEWIHT